MAEVSRRENRLSSPASNFITATEIIKYINNSLRNFDEEHAFINLGPNSRIVKEDQFVSPGFELQRRLPDGSCRRAYPDEQAAADFESKLQQTVLYVSKIQTPWLKLEWAEQQRLLGNQLYASKCYEEALDVYLSCLVAAQPRANSRDQPKDNELSHDRNRTSNTGSIIRNESVRENKDLLNTESSDSLALKYQKAQFVIFLKIMNNLAQTAMQLNRYQQAIKFCTIALDLISKENTPSETITNIDFSDNTSYLVQLSKIYFKRGKSQRLRGEYKASKHDLEESRRWLVSDKIESVDSAQLLSNGGETSFTAKSMLRDIQKEMNLLARAVAEERVNIKRRQVGMQKITARETQHRGNLVSCSHSNYLTTSLHPAIDATLDNKTRYMERTSPQLKRYSTLRAENIPHHDNTRNAVQHISNTNIVMLVLQTYFESLWRLAQRFIQWMCKGVNKFKNMSG